MKQTEQLLDAPTKFGAGARAQLRRELRTVPRLTLRFEDGENANDARPAPARWSQKLRPDQMSDATVMLAAIETGDSEAAEQLLTLVYDELRRLAASKMAWEAPGQTLQPTALVHEAWLRLVGDQTPSFKDR